MLGIKRVENRSVMPVPSKGRCAVACNKAFNAAEYGAFVQWASLNLPPKDFERIPAWGDVKDWAGKVIGCCDYEARQSNAAEALDEGCPFGLDLSEVVCFDHPIPCRGNVGMWHLSPSLAAQVSAADVLAACIGERVATANDAERLFRLAIPVAGENEGFFVLPLDDSRCVLSAPVLVSLGDPSTTVIQPSEVFAAAFKADAKTIILAHNHPSGNPMPSIQDRELTAALISLGDRLGVKVLDHLVIGDENKTVAMLK